MDVDPPIDHAELCARIRFRYDEPITLPPDEARERERSTSRRIGRLHSSGLRITPTLTPGLHAKMLEVCGRLLLRDAPRVYVEADPSINANAQSGGAQSVLALTSGLVNLLTVDELGAVLGHELGHVGMRHALREPDTGVAHVFMLERSRAAEVSCDRMSIIASGDLRTAVSAMVKVSSGLREERVALDIDALVNQLMDDPGATEREWEALVTHPVLPFRVWAMVRFAATDLCQSLIGRDGGEPFETVETEIAARFHSIGESLASRAATDHLHEALAWLGVLVVTFDGESSDAELGDLTTLVGSIWAEDAMLYLRAHGEEGVRARAKESLRALSMAHDAVKQRVTREIDRFIDRLGAPEAREAVRALMADGLSGDRS